MIAVAETLKQGKLPVGQAHFIHKSEKNGKNSYNC
jgi:hypothetical protein